MKKTVFIILIFGLLPILYGKNVKKGDKKVEKKEIYIPKNLNESFKELDKILSDEVKNDIFKKGEENMSRYHFGLGMWLRNNWGLWKGSCLSKWFNKRKIFHPDDMSAIILKSYWRIKHKKPIKLKTQIKFYQNYWKKVKQSNKEEKKRVEKVKRKIFKMMLHYKYKNEVKYTASFYSKDRFNSKDRYISKYNENLILLSSENLDKKGETLILKPYLFNQKTKKVHEIKINNELIYSSIVIENFLYILSKKGDSFNLYKINNENIEKMELPINNRSQLGVDNKKLLLIYPDSIYSFEKKGWKNLIKLRKKIFKFSKRPPLKYGNFIYFYNHRNNYHLELHWFDLKTKKITYLSDDIGIITSSGPRIEENSDYLIFKNNIYVTSGRTLFNKGTLLVKNSLNKYKIILINDELMFDGTFFGSKLSKDKIDINALATYNNEIFGIGRSGLYKIDSKNKLIKKIIEFKNLSFCNKRWKPIDLLFVNETDFIVSAFTGNYYFELINNKRYRVSSIDYKKSFGKILEYKIKK